MDESEKGRARIRQRHIITKEKRDKARGKAAKIWKSARSNAGTRWKGRNLWPDTFWSPAGEVFASLAISAFGKPVGGEKIGAYGSILAPQSKNRGRRQPSRAKFHNSHSTQKFGKPWIYPKLLDTFCDYGELFSFSVNIFGQDLAIAELWAAYISQDNIPGNSHPHRQQKCVGIELVEGKLHVLGLCAARRAEQGSAKEGLDWSPRLDSVGWEGFSESQQFWDSGTTEPVLKQLKS
ncbi:hypothetical protein DUI87_28017 [Hirundo rustica rustica]|uniref:Uncharacterized protein n=1 Tax=Hirundo rustica rustica TaxID=333673 RepID=A0A3M0JAI3_HIRRU|nr:hypothetical protein DUI87_28017 [Hirundo rustica rustica]